MFGVPTVKLVLGMQCYVVWQVGTDVSEELAASTFKIENRQVKK
jgi:hypothetical protein